MSEQLTEQQQQIANEVQTEQQQQVTDPSEREGQHTSGYFDSTYKWQAPGQEETVQEQQLSEEAEAGSSQLDELAKKVGIDPNDLGKAPEDIKQPEEGEEPLSADDWYSQQFSTEEAKQWASNFQKHVGIDIKEAYELINNTARVTQGLEQWRAEVKAQQDMQVLQQELGGAFQEVMPKVYQEFQRLQQVNPQQAAALDNIDGARYLAAYIMQRDGGASMQQPTQMNRQDVPEFQFPNVRQPRGGGGNSTPVIKMSEFINWSDDEVQNRYNEIVQAKANGTFIYDI